MSQERHKQLENLIRIQYELLKEYDSKAYISSDPRERIEAEQQRKTILKDIEKLELELAQLENKASQPLDQSINKSGKIRFLIFWPSKRSMISGAIGGIIGAIVLAVVILMLSFSGSNGKGNTTPTVLSGGSLLLSSSPTTITLPAALAITTPVSISPSNFTPSSTNAPTANTPTMLPPTPTFTPRPTNVPSPTPVPVGSLEKIVGRHTDAITSLACSSDGKTLASASRDGTVKLWDSGGLQAKGSITINSLVNAVAFSPDDKYVVSGSEDQKVNLWNLATNRLEPALSGHGKAVLALAYSRDGRFLASSSADNSIILRDGKNPSVIIPTNNWSHKAAIRTLAFSPDNRFLASGSNNATIKIWDLNTKQQLNQIDDHRAEILALAFSVDGKYMASSSGDGEIVLWLVDTPQFNKVAVLQSAGLPRVLSLAFSLDNKVLASGDGIGSVKLWDLNKRIETLSLFTQGQVGNVTALTYCAGGTDSRRLFSGSDDLKIVAWKVTP